VPPEDAAITWDHIAHSPNGSIAKAQRWLDYQPRYSSLEAVQESVRWLIAQGIVAAPPAWGQWPPAAQLAEHGRSPARPGPPATRGAHKRSRRQSPQSRRPD
jgi:hypothetical protein